MSHISRRIAEAWRVDDDAHQTAANQACDGQGYEPAYNDKEKTVSAVFCCNRGIWDVVYRIVHSCEIQPDK